MGGGGSSSGAGHGDKSSVMQQRRIAQAQTRVRKSIKSYSKLIEVHKNNIKNPHRKFNEWQNFSEKRKQDELRHWKHEIMTFRGNIKKALKNLKDIENGN